MCSELDSWLSPHSSRPMYVVIHACPRLNNSHVDEIDFAVSIITHNVDRYGAINAERSIPDSDPSFDEMLRDAAFDEVTIDPTFQHVMDTIKTATTNRNYAIPASLVLHETIHSADEGTLTVSISLPSQPYDRVLSTDAIVAAMKLDENVQITRESVSEPRESQRT